MGHLAFGNSCKFSVNATFMGICVLRTLVCAWCALGTMCCGRCNLILCQGRLYLHECGCMEDSK